MFFKDFRWNGNLKPGIEDLDPAGFFRKFVVPFPFSSTRGTLFRGFADYIKELDTFGIMQGLFVAGSFVSLKDHPHDVDVVCCFSGDAFDGLSRENADRIMPFLADDVSMLWRFGVQPFPLPVYCAGDERFAITEFAASFTMNLLGTDREDSPRGMVYMDWQAIGAALARGDFESMDRFCRGLPSVPDRRGSLYVKGEKARREHLEGIGRMMQEVAALSKAFPDVPSVRILVYSLFCGLFLILGGEDSYRAKASSF